MSRRSPGLGTYGFVAANTDDISSTLNAAPFPSALPISIGGKIRFNALSTSYQASGIGVGTTGGVGNRVQLAQNGDGDFLFLTKNSSNSPNTATFVITIPTDYTVDDFLYYCFCIADADNREGFIGFQKRVLQNSVSSPTIDYQAYDNIYFGFLPFFVAGGLEHLDGDHGYGFILNDIITEGEFGALVRGMPPDRLRRKTVDIFDLDGRRSEPFTSRRGLFTLNNNGADFSGRSGFVQPEIVFDPRRVRSGALSLAVPLLDDGDVFHAAQIDMNLTVPHLDDGDTLSAPALAQNVTVPLLDDLDTLLAPTIGQNIAIPLLDDSDGLFAPELGVNLAVPLLADGDSLYTMIVTEAGVQALVVPLLADDDNLIAPALSVGPVSLSLPLLASGTVLYGPGVRPELQMPHLANVSVLFNPEASYIIALPHLDDADVLNAMAVSVGATTLSVPKLDSLTVLYSPTLSPPLSHVIELFALYHPEIDLDGKLIQVVDLDALLQDDGQ